MNQYRKRLYFILLFSANAGMSQKMVINGNAAELISDSKIYYVVGENTTFVDWDMVVSQQKYTEHWTSSDSSENYTAYCDNYRAWTKLLSSSDGSGKLTSIHEKLIEYNTSDCEGYYGGDEYWADSWGEGYKLYTTQALNNKFFSLSYYHNIIGQHGGDLMTFIDKNGSSFYDINYYYDGYDVTGIVSGFDEWMDAALYFTDTASYILGFRPGSSNYQYEIWWRSWNDIDSYDNFSINVGKPFCIRLNQSPKGQKSDLTLLYFKDDQFEGDIDQSIFSDETLISMSHDNSNHWRLYIHKIYGDTIDWLDSTQAITSQNKPQIVLNDLNAYILSQNETYVIQILDLSTFEIVNLLNLDLGKDIEIPTLSLVDNELMFSYNQSGSGHLEIFDLELNNKSNIYLSRNIRASKAVSDTLYLGFGSAKRLEVNSSTSTDNINATLLTYALSNWPLNEFWYILEEESPRLSPVIYPNPTSETISFTNSVGEVRIYSIDGTFILKTDSEKPISVEHLKTGTYIITDSKGNSYKFYKK